MGTWDQKSKKRNKKVKRKNGRPENTLLSQSSRPAGWRTNSFLQNFLRSHLYLLLNFLFPFSFFSLLQNLLWSLPFPFSLCSFLFLFLKTFWCINNFFFTRPDPWKVLRLSLNVRCLSFGRRLGFQISVGGAGLYLIRYLQLLCQKFP